MTRLNFAAADLARVVDHAIKTKADLLLVHDQGVYLMSGGKPPDLIEPDKPSRYVAYAHGCNPSADGWWERSRALVGGDDFGEPIPWAPEIKSQIDRGAKTITLSLSQKRLALIGYRGG